MEVAGQEFNPNESSAGNAPMLRRIHLQNFMSVKEAVIDLAPLTIFVGPNASGKSVIFKALVSLSRLLGPWPVRGPKGEFTLDPAVGLDDIVWRGNSGLPIIFRVWFADDADEEPGYTLELRKDIRGWNVFGERIKVGVQWIDTFKRPFEHETERRGTMIWGGRAPYRGTLCHLVRPYRNDERAAPAILPLLDFAERFGGIWRYRPSASDIGSFTEAGKDQSRTQPLVRENGWGLPLALQLLQGNDRHRFEAIEHDLHRLFPHIRFINFDSERYGVRIAFTTDRSEDIVPASQESDGVLLTTFLLWRLYTAEPNLRVCLEEPENGVHPHLLHERLRLLQRFAQGDTERPPLQLFSATHSSDFLSAIVDRPAMIDAVRLVEFDPELGTTVHSLKDVNQLDVLLKVFRENLGELWWSGAIGAVPDLREPAK